MNEKEISLDFVVKSTNLCRYLAGEKDERILSSRFFDASCALAEKAYSLRNPLLSKNDASALKKEACLSADRSALYLDALYLSAFISAAQKESMSKSLDALKKEIL